MENPVVIFGAGTLGKIALDIFNSNNVLVYGFLDENKELHNTEISDVMVLGSPDDDGFLKIIGNKTEAFVAIDHKRKKQKLVEMLNERRKTMPVNAVHPKASVAEDSEIGHGNLIAARTFIGPGAKIKSHTVVHAGAIVDAFAEIGDFSEIGAGAIINTEAKIGEGVFVGSGAVIVSGIKVGKNARIGAGSVVIENVGDGETVFGNPAVAIKAKKD